MLSRLNDFVPCSTRLLYGAFGPCSALELCRKTKFSNNVHQQLRIYIKLRLSDLVSCNKSLLFGVGSLYLTTGTLQEVKLRRKLSLQFHLTLINKI